MFGEIVISRMNWMLFCKRILLLLIFDFGVVVYLLLNEWERRWIGWSIWMSLFVCAFVECVLLYQRWRQVPGAETRTLNASVAPDSRPQRDSAPRRSVRDATARRRRVQRANSTHRSASPSSDDEPTSERNRILTSTARRLSFSAGNESL